MNKDQFYYFYSTPPNMKTNDILDRNVRKESNSTRVSNKKQETIIVNSEVSSSAATFYTNSIADDIDEHEGSRNGKVGRFNEHPNF